MIKLHAVIQEVLHNGIEQISLKADDYILTKQDPRNPLRENVPTVVPAAEVLLLDRCSRIKR